MKQIHIKLLESLHRDLRIQAAIKDQTIQDYVIEAIEKQVKSDKAASNLTYLTQEGSSDDITK